MRQCAPYGDIDTGGLQQNRELVGSAPALMNLHGSWDRLNLQPQGLMSLLDRDHVVS
jgi:hypothetical protein